MMLNLSILELKYQMKHWSFYGAMVLSFLFGMFLINNQTPGNDIQITGSYFIVQSFAINMLVLPILVVIFANRALVRDFEHNAIEMIYTSCANKYAFLVSRFLALIVICLSIYLAFSLGIYLGLLKQTLVSSSATELPFSSSLIISTLAWVLVVLILPNLIFMTSILLSASLYFKRSLYLYIVSAIFYVGYQFFLMQSGSPIMANPTVIDPSYINIFAIIDPFGLTAYFNQVMMWLPEQKNSTIANFDGALLINRFGVLLIASAITAFAMFHFKATLPKLKSAAQKKPTQNPAKKLISAPNFANQNVLAKPSSYLSAVKKIMTVAVLEFYLTIRTKMFFTVCLILLITIGSEILSGYFHLENMGVTAIASMSVTINRYFFDVLPRLGGLFILLLATEICWRDHTVNIKQLVDATPATNAVLFAGRFLALLLVPLSFITLAILSSIALQLSYGGTIEWSVYLSFYWLIGLPMICIAAMCLFVHAIVGNRFVALFITFIVFISSGSRLLPSIGLEHHLWQFAYTPLSQYSDILKFSSNLDGFWGYITVWLSLALCLLMIGFGLFQRGVSLSLRYRVQHLTSLWGKSGQAIVTVSLLLFGTAFFNVIKQTYGVGNYQHSTDDLEWKINYEKTYSSIKDLPKLTVEQVTTHVDLMPAERRFRLQGNYRLKNNNLTAVKSIFITTPLALTYENLTVEGATLIKYDSEFGVYEFEFNKAIAPTQEVPFTFEANYQQNGYQDLPSDSKILADYVYFRSTRYMPWFGYLDHYQVKNDITRQDNDLHPIPATTLEEDIELQQGDFSAYYDWAEVETTISTSLEHTAIAPGTLVKQWQENNRNNFHYKTTGKIRHINHFLSTNLTVIRETLDGVNLEVYYQQGKEIYANRHLAAMKDALSYGNQHFGQYKANDLRLLEVPNLELGTAYAMPQTILISESVGFNVDLANTDAFDQLYRRTVHETAHQWWGHELNGADTEGGSVLVETLAKYTEMMLLEQKYGVDYVKRLIAFEQQRYFRGRSQDVNAEKPLYRADENHIIYSKGSAAMYTLRHSLGAEKMNTALAALIAQFSYPKPPATTLDLISLLEIDTNTEQKKEINRWFKELDTNDWFVENANVAPSLNGQFHVELCLTNRYQSTSNPTVHIVDSENNVIFVNSYFELQAMKLPNSTCYQIVLDKEPNKVILDPELYVLDSDRNNNEKEITKNEHSMLKKM